MPVRLHIKKEFLIDILEAYNGKAILPIYEGKKDLDINGEVRPTNIGMP